MTDRWPTIARCFIANPGGAYDPAPLPELDMPASSMPAVGDLVFSAAVRSRAERVFRVVERQFNPNNDQIALIVEEVAPPAVTPFT